MGPIVQPEGGYTPQDFPAAENNGNAQTVAYYNARRTLEYNQKCDIAEISIKAGRGSTVTSWPTVPFAMALALPDEFGVTWPMETNMPVCPARQRPADPGNQSPFVANRIHVGSALTPGASWFHIGADDTIPFGHEAVPATSEDGVSGMFLKYASGVASSNTTPTSGWYLKVGA